MITAVTMKHSVVSMSLEINNLLLTLYFIKQSNLYYSRKFTRNKYIF